MGYLQEDDLKSTETVINFLNGFETIALGRSSGPRLADPFYRWLNTLVSRQKMFEALLPDPRSKENSEDQVFDAPGKRWVGFGECLTPQQMELMFLVVSPCWGWEELNMTKKNVMVSRRCRRAGHPNFDMMIAYSNHIREQKHIFRFVQ